MSVESCCFSRKGSVGGVFDEAIAMGVGFGLRVAMPTLAGLTVRSKPHAPAAASETRCRQGYSPKTSINAMQSIAVHARIYWPTAYLHVDFLNSKSELGSLILSGTHISAVCSCFLGEESGAGAINSGAISY